MRNRYDAEALNVQLFYRAVSKLNMDTYSNRAKRYHEDAKLLWCGEHYIMVKTGLYQGHRSVSLWSREWLLLERGNPEKNAMLELALAAIDPCHRNWYENRRIEIWSSNPVTTSSTNVFSGRRWSSSLYQELCHLAERYDREFPEKEAKVSSKIADEHEFSKGIIESVMGRGFRVWRSAPTTSDFPFPVNNEYVFALASTPDEKLRVRPRSDYTVGFTVKGLTLSAEELDIMLNAIETIEARRAASRGKEGSS